MPQLLIKNGIFPLNSFIPLHSSHHGQKSNRQETKGKTGRRPLSSCPFICFFTPTFRNGLKEFQDIKGTEKEEGHCDTEAPTPGNLLHTSINSLMLAGSLKSPRLS